MQKFAILPTTLLGILVMTNLLSGCGGGRVNETTQNTTPLGTQDSKEPFVLINPFRDDPDNPSPHNPLIKKFGDTPQVRTFIRLKRKYLSGAPLTLDEVITLHSTDLSLYPHQPHLQKYLDILIRKKEYLEANELTDDDEYRYSGVMQFNLIRGDSVVIYHPDESKTISDSRLKDGKTVVVPPRRKSPYAAPDDENLTR